MKKKLKKRIINKHLIFTLLDLEGRMFPTRYMADVMNNSIESIRRNAIADGINLQSNIHLDVWMAEE